MKAYNLGIQTVEDLALAADDALECCKLRKVWLAVFVKIRDYIQTNVSIFTNSASVNTALAMPMNELFIPALLYVAPCILREEF